MPENKNLLYTLLSLMAVTYIALTLVLGALGVECFGAPGMFTPMIGAASTTLAMALGIFGVPLFYGLLKDLKDSPL